MSHISKLKSIVRTTRGKLRFHQTLPFPDNFFWGTSTSSHQIEGGNDNNDWWEWEMSSKKRFHSQQACHSYELYEKDIEIMESLGMKAYRFSLEWSRIEPKPGEWNSDAINHYRRQIALLNKKNIKPFVTLHHFTNPIWFKDMGGWKNKKSSQYYLRYVEYVVSRLGDLVDYWITINEPLVYSIHSYLVGVWPPEAHSYLSAFRVYRHFIKSHRRAYQLIHRIYSKENWHKPKVGFSNNSVSLYSYQIHSLRSWIFIRISDWIWNHSFYAFTKKTHDFVGINYYFHYRLKSIHFKALRFFVEARNEHREMSQVGWEVYPQGIFDVLIDMKRYQLPIFITENGIATSNESKRARYLIAYIKEVYHAIQAGAKVKGYFYWSLLDNFEWEKGYKPRFGLVEVNFKDFTRSMRRAAEIYSKITKTNSLPHSLLKYLGHSVE